MGTTPDRHGERDGRNETIFRSSLPDRFVPSVVDVDGHVGESDEDPVARAIHALASGLATALDDARSLRFLERVVTEIPLGRVRLALRQSLGGRHVRSPRAYFTALVRRELHRRRPS